VPRYDIGHNRRVRDDAGPRSSGFASSPRVETLPIRRERDRLIREAAARFFPEASLTVSARQLATALGRYATSADWQRDRDLAELPAVASARRRALHAILRANRCVPLGWRHIYEILMGRA